MSSSGPAYVYVLPTHGEDLLKLGHSRDPLARMQALHARFYEFFDLERGFALALETVADARALELQLHRRLREHRAPAPLTALRAGGGREWFRGAWSQLDALPDAHRRLGHAVQAPLSGWVRERLEQGGGLLVEWTAPLSPAEREARGADALATPAQRRVCDVLDAYLAFDLDPARWLHADLVDWHRAARRAAGVA